jgi:hypothetical protein
MREVWIGDGSGKTADAHRVVWIRAHGHPGIAHVLHSCSDGSSSLGCINVLHLRLGTVRENALDRRAAGNMIGETHASSKIKEDDVRTIRTQHVKGSRYPAEGSTGMLAERFGLSPQNVLHIVKRYSWKHI